MELTTECGGGVSADFIQVSCSQAAILVPRYYNLPNITIDIVIMIVCVDIKWVRTTVVPWGAERGRCGGVASRARALRPRLVLHSAALNNHANKSHLHFPAIAAAAAAACSWPEERCCWYRTRYRTSWTRRWWWRPPGVVDPGSRRHRLYLRASTRMKCMTGK